MPDSPVPKEVTALVARFGDHRDTYRQPAYNETQLRRDFVDPLFKALGWDIDNSQGYAEAYRDVVHEDKVTIQGSAKAPDYAFRIGGTRKFFVETKKPSVNLKIDPEPAFQLRRYAWSAKLPLSILTDFEEFAVYDTRVKPSRSDSASIARTLYFTCDQFEDKWDQIAGLFSREAILKGAFDRYADSKKKKRGTAEVDDAFLDLINGWRESLARNINKLNPGLSDRELNHAVQTTIDRIIFLRICEDRGTEDYARLRKLTESKSIYKGLLGLYYDADGRYNSGLFHFKQEKGRSSDPDELTTKLDIDDKTLKDIIKAIYYPSPYDFRVFPADVLGHVYERFLGQVITRTPSGKTVKIEDKPEVRKAGGVYYTPTYIVDYIVEHTVGELVKDKQPHEAAGRTEKQFKPAKGEHPIRVLDPACGSGSFLLGAYQFLLDWYLKQYFQDVPRWSRGAEPAIAQHSETDIRLTIAERKRILTDHIFGVDIDRQAVEVTKLSLLLKCLEGESSDTIGAHLFHMKERALPDLGDNIQCGNSLIGPDFYEGRPADEYSLEDRLRINAFDWNKAFAEVFADGGFDAVIGNPPYVLLQVLNAPAAFEYLSGCFESAAYKIDTYHLFLEKGVRATRDGGRWGMIVPNSFLRNRHARSLRSVLLRKNEVVALVHFDYLVFRASVETVVVVGRRTSEPASDATTSIELWDFPEHLAQTLAVERRHWCDHPEQEFEMPRAAGEESLIAKLESARSRLGEFADAYFGIQTYDRGTFVADKSRGNNWRPCIDGTDITDFHLADRREFVCVSKKAIKSGGNPRVHESDRIGVRQIGEVPIGTIIPGGVYTLNTIYNIWLKSEEPALSLEYLLGIILSKPIRWYWRQRFFDFKARFPKIKKKPLHALPIAGIDESGSPINPQSHEKVSMLVSRRMSAETEVRKCRQSDERRALQQQIDQLDREIDQLVYQLYELTDEEIAIVEAATAPPADK